MKRIKIIIAVVVLVLLGFWTGWSAKPISILKTEFKDRTVNVSVCDKAFSNEEKAICFAKDSCYGMIDTFTYDSLRGKIDFNCKK